MINQKFTKFNIVCKFQINQLLTKSWLNLSITDEGRCKEYGGALGSILKHARFVTNMYYTA